MLISFIIPVYNTGKYLQKCIESVYCQGLPNEEFEVIAINDGSTDNSFYILESLSRKYSNLLIYDQENQGSSAVRNRGVKIAQGKYVQFLDSDDYLVPDQLQLILTEENIDKEIDLLQFNFKKKEGNREFINGELAVNNVNIMSGIKYIIKNNIFTSACFFIIRKDFLLQNSLLFEEGVVCEDIEWTYKTVYKSSRIRYTNIVYYVNNDNPLSICHKPKDFFIKDLVAADFKLYSFFVREYFGKDKEFRIKIAKDVKKFLFIAYNYFLYYNSFHIINANVKKTCNYIKVLNKWLGCRGKEKIILNMWTYTPYIFSILLWLRSLYFKYRK